MAHILPVTSNQDFFGISIVEAVSYGAHPILPKRLSYPELFNYELNPNIFYNNKSELKDKIISSINNLDLLLEKTKILAQNTINKFNWSTVSEQYDRAFKDLIN